MINTFLIPQAIYLSYVAIRIDYYSIDDSDLSYLKVMPE